MESFDFTKLTEQISGFVWGNFLMFFLLGTGVYLLIRLGAVQIRLFFHSWSLIFAKDDTEKASGEITQFQALSTVLAATIGTGNIAGVATAIASGGPGAVFWMWVTAFVGMGTKFCCCLLGQKYKQTDKNGEVSGGPMYYLKYGMKVPWLGILFALFTAIASFGIGNMVQANSAASPVNDMLATAGLIEATSTDAFCVYRLVIGVLMAIAVGAVIIGGIKRIGSVAEKVVPLMALVYFAGGLTVILMNAAKVPSAFALIFSSAFGVESVAGGVLGYGVAQAMRFGISRGLFSNEAGLGSAPIAYATVKTSHPVKGGLVAMLAPFIDTIVVCTLTAIVIIISGLYTTEGLTGASLTAAAFEAGLPGWGAHIVSVGLSLFAFTTMVGWSYYGDRSVKFLFEKHGNRPVVIYRIIFVLLIPVGAAVPLPIVWNLSDIANGLMALPNLVALIALSGVVATELKNYLSLMNEKSDNA